MLHLRHLQKELFTSRSEAGDAYLILRAMVTAEKTEFSAGRVTHWSWGPLAVDSVVPCM